MLELNLQETEVALNFLGRAQLVGNEVPAFVTISNKLNAHRAQLIGDSLKPPVPDAATPE